MRDSPVCLLLDCLEDVVALDVLMLMVDVVVVAEFGCADCNVGETIGMVMVGMVFVALFAPAEVVATPVVALLATAAAAEVVAAVDVVTVVAVVTVLDVSPPYDVAAAAAFARCCLA